MCTSLLRKQQKTANTQSVKPGWGIHSNTDFKNNIHTSHESTEGVSQRRSHTHTHART